MRKFINGIGTISAQAINTRAKSIEIIEAFTHRLTCVEPDYKELIAPMQLRRMSKVVRFGIATAKQALKDAGIETPNIISLGTAYGCLADTENFLHKLLAQEEQMLTPTAFIQSTHNTVSGQIALLTNCYGHNFTYVHRGYSFETALQESCLWIDEQKDDSHFNALTGGIDELTNDAFAIIERFGAFKKSDTLVSSKSKGTIAGEGANLFVVSNQQLNHSYAELLDVYLCFGDDIQTSLQKFLQKNEMTFESIDTCFVGVNEDSRYDEIILKNVDCLTNAQFLKYKKYCGEYPTSNAFALTLACVILNGMPMPKSISLNKDDISKEANTVLIYNHYKNKNHSFILLKKL